LVVYKVESCRLPGFISGLHCEQLYWEMEDVWEYNMMLDDNITEFKKKWVERVASKFSAGGS